ncbi:MAG: hypothetical protein H0T60_17030 [Acidobacteria bacterium]|nr:hypothetical protein [Acidobacteriota bacterium]
MALKIENHLKDQKLPRRADESLKKILTLVPREHLRGLERLRIVDRINDARLSSTQLAKLPGLYHPKQGTQGAWIEVALVTLIPTSKPFYQRLLPRLYFRANLAAVVLSLIGQHYYLTLRHSVKKDRLEPSVRAYTEKYLKKWSENEHSIRTRLFKPLQPRFERWARSLQKRAVTKSGK